MNKPYLNKKQEPGDSSVCPSNDELGAFLDGCANEEITQSMEQHLAACSDCRNAYAHSRLSEAVSPAEADRMPRSLSNRLHKKYGVARQENVLELIYHAGLKVLEQISGAGEIKALAPMPARGETLVKTYTSRLGNNIIEIAPERMDNGLYEVWMAVINDDIDTQVSEWQLWHNDKLHEHQPGNMGEVLFAELPAGKYRCVLQLDGQSAGVVELHLVD